MTRTPPTTHLVVPRPQHTLGAPPTTHLALLYSNSIWRQSSMPTSIFRELFISGKWLSVWTATSSSLMMSERRRVITTRKKYLMCVWMLCMSERVHECVRVCVCVCVCVCVFLNWNRGLGAALLSHPPNGDYGIMLTYKQSYKSFPIASPSITVLIKFIIIY